MSLCLRHEDSNNMKTLIFDVFHVFRYTWFTMEALEDTWENLQKIIEVCNLTSEICLFYSNEFCANSSDSAIGISAVRVTITSSS